MMWSKYDNSFMQRNESDPTLMNGKFMNNVNRIVSRGNFLDRASRNSSSHSYLRGDIKM